MRILVDSREQRNGHVIRYFQRNAIPYLDRVSFRVGDYREMDNEHLVIDRKFHLTEVCGNVCQQHERFRREMLLANELGIHLIILVEHGRGIKSIDDVEKWENPRIKKWEKLKAQHERGENLDEKLPIRKPTSGETLAKLMRTMSERYGVEWRFCEKADTGRVIVEILGGAHV